MFFMFTALFGDFRFDFPPPPHPAQASRALQILHNYTAQHTVGNSIDTRYLVIIATGCKHDKCIENAFN